jgi:hypothetical protein
MGILRAERAGIETDNAALAEVILTLARYCTVRPDPDERSARRYA